MHLAIRWQKTRLQRQAFNCLKFKTKISTVVDMVKLEREKNTKLKTLKSWREFTIQRMMCSKIMSDLKNAKKLEILQHHWNLIRDDFKARQHHRTLLKNHRSEQKRKWLAIWVQETNLSRFRVMSDTEIEMNHINFGKNNYSNIIKKVWRRKAISVFTALRSTVSQRVTNKIRCLNFSDTVNKSYSSRVVKTALKVWYCLSRKRAIFYGKITEMHDVLTKV